MKDLLILIHQTPLSLQKQNNNNMKTSYIFTTIIFVCALFTFGSCTDESENIQPNQQSKNSRVLNTAGGSTGIDF